MRVECEKLSERVATPELIRELVRDGKRRGEFMILMRSVFCCAAHRKGGACA